MERLNSRNVFPPGGWLYRHVETGWHISGQSFNGTVEAMQRHFKANPQVPVPTDFDSVAWILEQFTLARLQPAQKQSFVSDLNPVMAATHLHEPTRKCKTCGR